MKIHQATITLSTPGRGPLEITGQVAGMVREAALQTGLCQLFCQHTSASLLITENADPTVLRDLEAYLTRQVPVKKRSGSGRNSSTAARVR